jgi:hypothetical protein
MMSIQKFIILFFSGCNFGLLLRVDPNHLGHDLLLQAVGPAFECRRSEIVDPNFWIFGPMQEHHGRIEIVSPETFRDSVSSMEGR